MDKTTVKSQNLLDCYEISPVSFKVTKVKRNKDYIKYFSKLCF